MGALVVGWMGGLVVGWMGGPVVGWMGGGLVVDNWLVQPMQMVQKEEMIYLL